LVTRIVATTARRFDSCGLHQEGVLFDELLHQRLVATLRGFDPLLASATMLMLAAISFVELEDGKSSFVTIAEQAFEKAVLIKRKNLS
jgi:hypothetical protein